MKNGLVRYKVLFILLVVVLAAVFALLYAQTIEQDYNSMEKLALEQARASYNKDLVYRRWVAKNGGVYVLTTDSFQPNPYLKVDEREIISTRGKTYTMVNPAYMTRMVHELAKEQYNIKGHITSLKPINPKNKPDEWEKRALQRFERGEQDYYSIENEGGKGYLRYMGAIVAQKACLKCHEYQGYKEGDIRGGISVAVPLSEYGLIYRSAVLQHSITFGIVFFLLLILVFIAYKVISRDVKRRKAIKDIELEYARHHKKIIQSSMDGFIIVDKAGNILEVNPAYCKMTGYTEEELLKMKVPELKHAENKAQVKEHLEQMWAEGKDRFESILKRKDGALIYVEVNAFLDPSENKKLVSFVEDITARKKAQKELQDSEKKYRHLFENMNEAFALHKVIKNREGEVTDYTFIDINPKFEELTGLKKEQLVGKTVLEVMPETEKCWIERYGKVALTGQAIEFSNYARELKKHYRVKAYSPEKEYFAVSFSDATLQKEVERKIKESELRYKNIYNKTPIMLHSINQEGKLVDVSNYWLEVMGYARDEVIGKRSTDFLTEASKKYALDVALPEFFAKGFIKNVPYQYVKKNGEVMDTLLSAETEFDENGKVVRSLAVSIDVTALKTIEEKLRAARNKFSESEKKFKSFFNDNPSGTFVWEYKANDFILTEVNKMAKAMTHGGAKNFIGLGAQKIYDGSPLMLEKMQECYAKRGITEFEYLYKSRFDGKSIWQHFLITYVVPDKLIMYITNIDDKKKAEQALRLSEQKYRDLVETAQELIWKCDGKGRYIYLNKAWETTFGYSLDEMIGKSFGDFQTRGDFQRDMSIFTRLLAGGNIVNYETTHLAKNGTKLTLLFNAIHVTDEKGNIIGTQGTATDITQRKKYEEELKKHQNHLEQLVKERTDELEASNQELKAVNEELYKQKNELELAIKRLNNAQTQLIQAEKMASLGVLVAGVAHEINNPVNFINSSLLGLKTNLTYLLGFTDLYQQLSEDNLSIIKEIEQKNKDANIAEVMEMFKRSVEIIEVGIERTMKIVKSLKSFARSDEKQLGRYNVHENIDNTLLILYNQYKNRIVINKEYGNIPIITCYSGQINQVVMNLLINAVQAIKDKGVITIRTNCFNEHTVSITIKDTGVGIEKENIGKIFDPFYTTKKVGAGTGMGLSISYNIIKEHKGEIIVSSEKGTGSCFEIRLPVKIN